MRLYSDDYLNFTISSLGHIAPASHRRGVVLITHPHHGAIGFELNTHASPPFVVFSYDQYRQAIELEAYETPIGTRYFFIGGDGQRANKIFFVPDIGFGTRKGIGLVARATYLGKKKRLRLSRTRTVAKLQIIYSRYPTLKRQVELEAKLERLNNILQ